MQSITIKNLSIQFDANQITKGTTEEQARQAIEQINSVLQREPYGMAAQIIDSDSPLEIEEDSNEEEDLKEE